MDICMYKYVDLCTFVPPQKKQKYIYIHVYYICAFLLPINPCARAGFLSKLVQCAWYEIQNVMTQACKACA